MGGGSSTPPPMTTETTGYTTQEPTVTSGTSTTNSATKIPSWLESTSQSLVQRATALSNQAYTPYTGQRLAEFDPMVNQAFQRIRAQGVAGQVGTATGLAEAAGTQGLAAGQFDPYQTGRFTGETAQQYMDPYMQGVVNTQLREAQREADIATTTRAGAATRAGAFGGSRQAIMDAEAQRNLATQKGDIQAAGLQKAYEGARAQFNVEDALAEQARRYGTEAGLQGGAQALSAAQVLGQLGTTQFGQEMDITQGLGYAGALRQQHAQTGLDIAYQDFLAQQKYPYEQLQFLQSIAAGVPYSTTQTSTTESSGVTTPGKTTSTTTAVQKPTAGVPAPASPTGGASSDYAEGGITGLLSDQQLQQRQQNPNVPTIARLAAEMQARENSQLRQASAGLAGQGMQGRPTVAEEVARGLDALPVRDDMVGYADGGILGYENGGDVDAKKVYRPFYEQAYRQREEKGSIYSPDFGYPPKERAAREALRAQTAGKDQPALDAQAAEDRASISRLVDAVQQQSEAAGRAIVDIGAMPIRGLAGAYDTAVVRPMRAAGIPAGYISPILTPEGAETSSMTPFMDVMRARQAAPSAAPALPPQDAARAQVLRERQGLGSLGVPTPAPAGAPTAPADLASASPAATARLTAPQPAAAQPPAMPGIQDALSQYRESQRRAADEGAAVVGEEAQAMADIERAALERFEAQQKTAGQGDADTRKRIAEREKKMDQAEKNALLVALARTAIGAYSARTGSTTANLARGLQMGIEGYAADTAKIDETRDSLRKELDRLDALRQQAAEASGKRREELTGQVKKAEVAAKFAAKKFGAAQGAKISDKEAEVMLTFAVNGLQEQKKQEYKLQEIAAQGVEARKTQAAKPISATAATSGTVTAKDMAKLRDDALADWSDSRKGRALQKQFGSFDNYLRTRVANYSGAAPTTPAAPSTKGWSVSPQ